jgi:hypothetical protein
MLVEMRTAVVQVEMGEEDKGRSAWEPEKRAGEHTSKPPESERCYTYNSSNKSFGAEAGTLLAREPRGSC